MSGRRPGLGALPAALPRWLGRQPAEPPPGPAAPTGADGNADLLRRAARCYVVGGLEADAARVFDLLGEGQSAAPIYERQGWHAEAAARYLAAGDWHSAARCLLAAGSPEEAAECQIRAGCSIEAAWTLAHLARRVQRALALLEKEQASQPSTVALAEVARARCEVELDQRPAAARRIRTLLVALASAPPSADQELVRERCVVVADLLARPDLAAAAHGVALQIGAPEAAGTWEAWARVRFGAEGRVVVPTGVGLGEEAG